MTLDFKVFEFLWRRLVPEELHEADLESVQPKQEAEPVVADGLAIISRRGHLGAEVFFENFPSHLVYHVEGVVRVAQAAVNRFQIVVGFQNEQKLSLNHV